MGFRHGFKAESNRIALRIRASIGLQPIDPIDPEEVCRVFDVQLIKLSDVGCDVSRFLGTSRSAFSAVTVPCGFTTAIVHNDSHHPHRQRSNIAHELAHSFLGHEHAPPLTDEGERVHNGGIEAEANYLAGTLLIPNEAARYIVLNGLEQVAGEAYGVSRKMLEFRLRVSGARTIASRMIAGRSRMISAKRA